MLNKIRIRSNAYAYESRGRNIWGKGRRKHSFHLENKFLFTLNLSVHPFSALYGMGDEFQHVALTFKQYVILKVFSKFTRTDISFIVSERKNNNIIIHLSMPLNAEQVLSPATRDKPK